MRHVFILRFREDILFAFDTRKEAEEYIRIAQKNAIEDGWKGYAYSDWSITNVDYFKLEE